jgi:hypothetical protein
MKRLRYIILAMMIAPMLIISNGCGDDPVTLPDTTDTIPKDTAGAGFKVGFDIYELVINDDQTDGHYRAADNKTLINVVGQSEKADGGVVEGKGEIELEFPGNIAGSWSQANMDEITIELATGVLPMRTEYSYDANSNMIITITEYGEVGEKIKGTFSGLLKSGINQRDVRNGFFSVTRSADQ